MVVAHIPQKHNNIRIERVERLSPTRIRLGPMISHESNEIDEMYPGLDFFRMARFSNKPKTIGSCEEPREEQSTTSNPNSQNVQNNDHNTFFKKATNFLINSTCKYCASELLLLYESVPVTVKLNEFNRVKNKILFLTPMDNFACAV